MVCARCGGVIRDWEAAHDFHERDCPNDGYGRCWCDTSLKLHPRCCGICNPEAVAS